MSIEATLRRHAPAAALTVLAGLMAGSPATARPAQEPSGEAFVWDARKAEHLLNRAGFGARPLEIARFVELGLEGAVRELVEGRDGRAEPFFATDEKANSTVMRMDDLDEKARDEMRNMARRSDQAQMRDFTSYWFERMVSGEDPLREKMTLYWHGHFASSHKTVKNSYEMIRQNELFHARGLDSFEDLVRGIARDPAMLEYLDNDSNRKKHPNENFARELMELFTLGEGNYTEQDVLEAARAFTGWTDRRGEFRFRSKDHDNGSKTVLGVTGNLDGDDVIDILLAQPACSEYLATELITWFEGVGPDPHRAALYGDFLASNDYDLGAFLARLFQDPAFYRDEVVGARISSPVEFMVGTARRLGVRPPMRLLAVSSSLLGQQLFFPPSVKGWDEGTSWITTSSLMQRGNLAGMLVGVVEADDILEVEEAAMGDGSMSMGDMDGGMEPEMGGAMEEDSMGADAMDTEARPAKKPKRRLGDLKALQNVDWRSHLNLTARMERLGARKDGALVRTIADELLAVEIGEATRNYLRDHLREQRRAAGVKNGELLDDPQVSEPILRDLAHLVLSLPEAQLN